MSEKSKRNIKITSKKSKWRGIIFNSKIIKRFNLLIYNQINNKILFSNYSYIHLKYLDIFIAAK